MHALDDVHLGIARVDGACVRDPDDKGRGNCEVSEGSAIAISTATASAAASAAVTIVTNRSGKAALTAARSCLPAGADRMMATDAERARARGPLLTRSV